MTSPLQQPLDDYLTLRRALGYRLVRPEKLLTQFLGFLQDRGESRVTAASALDWSRLPANADANWWAYRLSVVRGLATYLHALDPAHEVPAADLLPQRPLRASPYLYSEADIAALVAATAVLRTAPRRAMFATLIGLLAVTGIRVGEAIGLDRADVDLPAGRLLIRHAKFGKSRELALHPSTVDALQRYRRLRDEIAASTGAAAFFVSAAGTRLNLLQRPPHLPPAHPCRWAGAAIPHLPAPDPRPTALLRGRRDAAGLRRRRGRPDPPDAVIDLARSRPPRQHLLVPVGVAGTDGARRAAPRNVSGGPAVTALAPTLQAFFTDRLIRQRNASSHTIAAYRDTWRLLLGYAATTLGSPPSQLDLAVLDAPLIAGFLDHLERDRGNSIRTRNARLAAIHSLFRYAALQHPEHAGSISRVLAIPPKRFDKAVITYLTEPEVDALLACCDQSTWTGRRDHTLLLLAVQTGLRISDRAHPA